MIFITATILFSVLVSVIAMPIADQSGEHPVGQLLGLISSSIQNSLNWLQSNHQEQSNPNGHNNNPPETPMQPASIAPAQQGPSVSAQQAPVAPMNIVIQLHPTPGGSMQPDSIAPAQQDSGIPKQQVPPVNRVIQSPPAPGGSMQSVLIAPEQKASGIPKQQDPAVPVQQVSVPPVAPMHSAPSALQASQAPMIPMSPMNMATLMHPGAIHAALNHYHNELTSFVNNFMTNFGIANKKPTPKPKPKPAYKPAYKPVSIIYV